MAQKCAILKSITPKLKREYLNNDLTLMINKYCNSYLTINMGDQTKEKKIGYYLLGKTIGEGTFGKVKEATHTLTGEKVAIKILVKEKIIDVADVERVAREIHILKLIRHPSIIQLYQIIQTSRHLFLVMQYVENGELFDYIVKKAKIDQKEACKFFKNLIGGVHYLHKLYIVHRDLKPQNLLINWHKNIKIVDFGLSNTYKQGELLKTACGSPCYAAPQMIASKKYNGLEVDIWSCGVILFAMVCGYLPFQDNNTSQLYKKILSGEYVLPNFVSEQFRKLLEGVLHVDPSKRFRISEIYAHEWCQQVQDIPLESGIIIGFHRIPVDRDILNKLTEFQFDVEYAVRCIEANKHNHITTAYYLLLKKHLRAGNSSVADLSSPTFDYDSVQPFKRIQNQKKIHFFGTNQQSPIINLQNTDIKINRKSQKGVLNVKPETSKNQIKLGEHRRSNNFFQKRKQVLSVNDSRKFHDLRMYLRVPRKKDYYSETKRKQDRREQELSLHHEPKENLREEEPLVIKFNTEHSEEKPRKFKTKYQRSKCPNRFK